MIGLRVSEEELRDLLVKRLGVIGEGDFDQARAMALRLHVPIERAVLDRTGMPTGFLLKQLAEVWGVPFLDLKVSDVDPEVLDLLGKEYARAHALLAFAQSGAKVCVAMANPRDAAAVAEVERLTLLEVEPYLAPEIAIRRAQLLYRPELRELLRRATAAEREEAMTVETVGADERAAVALLERVLNFGAMIGTSDIHIEPYELETLVRYRIDGLLRDVLSVPPEALAPLLVRVKLLCGMRIDERRAPQDGQFSRDMGGFDLDFRVSTLPTVWGEKIVLRVHSKEIVLQDLEDLGLSARDYEIVLRSIRRPYGMVLMTGPTASGKSTSLYAMIMRIGVERKSTVNVSTIEDPVEYRLPRVNQVQVNPAAGVEFGNTLRALLRQDPDVIMVGEIRDFETAELAVRAALVGRLLLSTLHTNDAPTAVPRLFDIGVAPYLLASTLSLVVAQRLVRRICANCRESTDLSARTIEDLRARPDFEETVAVLRAEGILGSGADPFAGLRLYRGRGCAQCSGTGYRRRLALFELLEVNDDMRALIRERRDAATLREAAVARGMKSMFQDGLAKVLLGETTLEEVYRVTA